MRALKYTGYGLLALLVLLLAWGFLVEPRLIDTEEQAALIPDLPTAWVGQRIAVVADYQVGMWGANTGTMRRITERLVEERPAAVLLAGDFVYQPGDDPTGEIETVVEIIRALPAAGIPTFAVLGNHDYSLDLKDDPKNERLARRVQAALEVAGVRVLHNEAVPLERTAGTGDSPEALYLVGIGSEWAHEARPEAALRGVPQNQPRIVFMHNPNSFPKIPARAAPLAVAAHTHGGQIRIPGTPSWSWLDIVADGEPHADGWIEDGYGQPGNRLYVNRGIGFSDLPVRINCLPELTYFRLMPGDPTALAAGR
jgi:predicted MPP superfamily phosphohydrolase